MDELKALQDIIEHWRKEHSEHGWHDQECCVTDMLMEISPLLITIGVKFPAALAEARRAALEEAAVEVESWDGFDDSTTAKQLLCEQLCKHIAKAIRALHDASKAPLDTPSGGQQP